MVLSTTPMHSIFHPGQLSVETGHFEQKYFEEDDGLLDEAAFNHNAIDSSLEMSPPIVDSRRGSFAFGPSLFSPKQEAWQHLDMQTSPSVNPFIGHNNTNPFMRVDHQQRSQQQQTHQHQAMGAQMGSWPMTASTSANSGVATPIASYDGMPADFDTFQRGPIQSPFPAASAMFNPMNGLPGLSAQSNDAVATTSTSSVPMQMSSSAASIDTQPTMTRKIPPQSPQMRSHNELRRGDGIRKKNARFEIPAERNLNNIDQLISQSKDEQEIKELKQQKRLLRNRQAALDSRQRKKLHTERLEDEKKHYTVIITEMEHAIEGFKLQVSDLLQEKQKYDQYLQNLNLEKEDMIRKHTIETAELRKKIGVLSSHVQVLEGAAAAVAMPSHASAFTSAGAGAATPTVGSFGDIDGLGMDAVPDPWDQLIHINTVEQQPQQQQQLAEIKHEVQLIPTSRKATGNETVESALASTERSGIQGGLLFMLLLVGAFVTSSRRTPSIPHVSEEVRAASDTLLENVLKDAGVAQDPSGMGMASTAATDPSSATTNFPASSISAWTQPSSEDMPIAPSMLGQLSDELIQPTDEQTNKQAFSLSAAQYNGVVDYQHLPAADHSTSSAPASQGRRSLAEALASMRSNSKAEVYTRSLLWDQIPGDVVREFAKMVSEVNTASPRADGGH